MSTLGLALLDGCGSRLALPGSIGNRLETTTIRLPLGPSLCTAPSFLAEDYLKAEGFTNVQYVPESSSYIVEPIVAGKLDAGLQFSGPLMVGLDSGSPVVALAGVHVGCFELFGGDNVHTMLDLKGKSVAILALGGPEHVFLSSMAAYVGLDPQVDITWLTRPQGEGKQLFIDGKIDAFLAFPPVAQELRAMKVGRVVVNSMLDQPWSQYFCCMVAMHQEFVKANPVATKAVVRSILKAADECAQQPEKAAHYLIDRGYFTNYDYAVEALREIPYNRWRQYDPSDTVRFYSLRLREAGMVKKTPEEIIAQGTDWRFLNEIKKESLQSYLGSSNYWCRSTGVG